MKAKVNKRVELPNHVANLRDKILEAMEYIDRALQPISSKRTLSIDYAFTDAALARAISLLASARAVAITQGQLSDPAFDDGDTWDWDDEIGLPDEDFTRQAGKGGGA